MIDFDEIRSWLAKTGFVTFLLVLIWLPLGAGCDISPVPTPIPGGSEDDPYFDDEDDDGTFNLAAMPEGGGGGMGLENGGEGEAENENSDEIGGGEAGTGQDISDASDVVSAPDVEEELDGESDEDSESYLDASPNDEDTLATDG